MTDVLEIARSRRSRLLAEVARLEDFIGMAETLLKLEQDPDHAKGWLTEGNGAAAPSPAPGADGESAEEDPPAPRDEAKKGAAQDEAVQAEARAAASAGTEGTTEAAEAKAAEAGADGESSGQDGAGGDHFLFPRQGASEDDELVLTTEDKAEEARLDAAIGQKLRQRRWMMGMTKKQLADRVGIDVEEIQNFELGMAHIGTGRMWQLASALDVPTSYFFDNAAEPASDAEESAEPAREVALARTA